MARQRQQPQAAPGWTILDGDKALGPMSEVEARRHLRAGGLSDNAMVNDGSGWVAVRLMHPDDGMSGSELPAPSQNGLFTPPPLPPQALQSQGLQSPAVAPAQQEAPPEDEGPLERDRIVLLGRSRAGKTIYLAQLYAKLWRSLDGLTAKAVSGNVHRSLMSANQDLAECRWPDATVGATPLDLEIDYHGQKRLMVALDFAGELFRRAFVLEDHQFAGVKQLVNHIDRAAAVILLVDPSVATGKDADAAMDDDFGIVQAVQRIRNWPGGEEVPIVLALTKMDLHQHLLDQTGGTTAFVRRHFPALVRLMKQIPIFQVSAVQCEPTKGGHRRPRRDSAPVNIDTPLRYCLRHIESAQLREQQETTLRQQRLAAERQMRKESEIETRHNRLLAIAIVLIVVLGGVLAIAILLSGN